MRVLEREPWETATGCICYREGTMRSHTDPVANRAGIMVRCAVVPIPQPSQPSVSLPPSRRAPLGCLEPRGERAALVPRLSVRCRGGMREGAVGGRRAAAGGLQS